MPLFSKPQNVVINNGNFIDVTNVGFSGIDFLLEKSIPDAAYNSSARHPPPQCHPGTREQYIEDITHWVVSVDQNLLRIYWMKGPAGVGKTAIAQTCTEKINNKGRLAASFFFSINGRDDHTRFFPSLAYQLSTNPDFSEYRALVESKIRHDRTILTKSMATQFQELIAGPLQELERKGKGTNRRAIFIDGLDECQDERAQTEIIEIIAESVRDNTTSFCWAFFSRPEPHIDSAFAGPDVFPLCYQTTLPISLEINGEIELYLKSGLQGILRHNNLFLQRDWPSDDDIRTLVRAAAGLFIYAATILRFIRETTPMTGPEEPLRAIIQSITERHETRSRSDNSRHSAQPFADLDAFYTLIMRRIPDNMLPSVQLLLLTMIRGLYSETGLPNWYLTLLANVLRFSESKVKTICHKLNAVLNLEEPRYVKAPNAEDESSNIVSGVVALTGGLGGIVSFYHKSFVDFLTDPNRSGVFCIDRLELKETLVNCCIQTLSLYDQGYCLQDSGLVLVKGDPVLSWPSATSHVDGLLNVLNYDFSWGIMIKLLVLFTAKPQMLQQLTELNHRLLLEIQGFFTRSSEEHETKVFGSTGLEKNIRGTVLFRVSPQEFCQFRMDIFLQYIQKWQSMKMLRPVVPTNLHQFCKFLLCHEFQGQPHLMVWGQGDKKTYWYWELDVKLKYYRDYQTSDLAEGYKIFQEELSGFFKL